MNCKNNNKKLYITYSLGVTQSLMYAFSKAWSVFTTANSSAMLSYLLTQSKTFNTRQIRHSACKQFIFHCTTYFNNLRQVKGCDYSTITYFSRSLAFLYSLTSYKSTVKSGYSFQNVNYLNGSYDISTLTSYNSGLLAGAGCKKERKKRK